MAQKEVSFKIKVNGEELTVTGKQVDVFKAQIKTMREELHKLGERTSENAEIFDKLKGDLNALEVAFGETKTEIVETGDAIQEMGNQEEEASKQTKSYAAQIRELKLELAGLGERTSTNAEQYDSLQSRIRSLSEAQEDLNRGTQKLDDALSALPGPVGMIGRGIKGLEDTFKNAKSAFKGLTEAFPILRNAIAATGIGALVIVFGLIVAAVMKAAKSFEPLQTAFGKFGRLIDIVMKGIKPLTDFILNVFVGAIEMAAKAIAFLTGNLEEYNEAAANEEANAKLEKNLKQQERWFEANADKYDEFTQRKIKADIDYNKKKLELNQQFKDGEIKTQEELEKATNEFYAKRNREIIKADKDRAAKAAELDKAADDKAKAASEKQKALREKALQERREYENKLRALQDGNALLRIKDENERQREQLRQQAKNEIISIEQTVKNETRRKNLIVEVNEKLRLELKNLNDKIEEDRIKSYVEFQFEVEKLQVELNDNILQRDRDLFVLQLNAERTALTKRLDELKLFGEERDKILKDNNELNEKRLKEFDERVLLDRILSYKALLKQDALFTTSLAELESQRQQNTILTRSKFLLFLNKERQDSLALYLKDLRVAYGEEFVTLKQTIDEQKRALEEGFASKQITELNYLQTKEQLRQQEYQNNVSYTQRNIALDQLELQSRQATADKTVEIAANASGLLAAIAGDNLELQKAAAIADAAVAIARIVIDTQRANVAFTASVAPLGPIGVPIAAAYATKNTIAAALSIATIVASGIQKLVAINTSQFKSQGSSSTSSGGAPMADGGYRGYEDGGLIGGRRHAQGGTLIEAEAGEAIMTRGAVAMFAPLLSMMNQAGGGTAFSPNAMVSSYDKPKPMSAEKDSSTIIKTYVVESDLTSAQQRQARLKDLSVL